MRANPEKFQIATGFDQPDDMKSFKAIDEELYYIANTPQDVVEYLNNYTPLEKEIKPEDIYTSVK